MNKLVLIIITCFGLIGCAGHSMTRMTDAVALSALDQDVLVEQWGIRAERMMLTGAGNLIDFRYLVVDPIKAAKAVSPKIKPMLVDEKTGMLKDVPMPANIGALRNTGRNLQKGRKYFILFNNPGGNIHLGDKVTVIMGDYKLEHIEVQ